MSRFLEKRSPAVQCEDISQYDKNVLAYQDLIRPHLEKLKYSANANAKIAVLTACYGFLSGDISYDGLLEVIKLNPKYKPSFFSVSVMCGVPAEIEELVSEIVAFGGNQRCIQSATPC